MSLPSFNLPHIQENSTGWGPSVINSDGCLDKNIFQQYNKCDRVGRIVDWLGVDRYYKKSETRDRYNERIYGSSATAGSQFDYVHDAEESNFQLVDSFKPQRPPQRNYRRTIQFKKLVQKDQEQRRDQGKYGQMGNKANRSIAKERMRAFKQWQRRGGGNRGNVGRGGKRFGDRQGGKRAPSIQVRPEWPVLEELDFARLSKLNLPVETGQDIEGERYGTIYYYDKIIDKVSVKNPKRLERIDGTFYNITTTDDPVIEKLAQSGVGNVFATDIILATLMACTRSVNSWDIIAHKVGNKLFFDKRETGGFSNPVDALWVSETAQEPPQFSESSGLNNAKDLATEALYINQNFRRQVLKRNDEPYKYENETVPFEEDNPKSRSETAYIYRLWSLGAMGDGTPIKLVARTEIDGVMIGPNQENQKLTIKAFNEWDSQYSGGQDWRKSLDTQKGALLATEMKNNSCKLAKWTLQAILAGSDYIKFGYVSRVNVRNSVQHEILGTQQYKPTEFAKNIDIDLANAWGILRVIIEFFMKKPNGKYLLLKDPLQPVVRIYSLPEGTFDSSEESSESSEAEDDGE